MEHENNTPLTIVEEVGEDTFYLNHSCLSTCSFGSFDMAWTTDDNQKAQLMLERVIKVQGRDDFKIIDFF